MGKTATIVLSLVVFLFAHSASAQLGSEYSTGASQPSVPGIHIDFTRGDTTLLSNILSGRLLQSPLQSIFSRRDSDDGFWSMPDSTDDSLLFELKMGDLGKTKKRKMHSFLVTEPPYDREIPHLETMPFMDFNRVNGFYLGIGTPASADFGKHDEIGIHGGIGYGFAEHKGQS